MWSKLDPLKLGKLLDQLFHAELRELYCNLRVVAVTLAAEDHAVAVLWMADTLSALEADHALRLRDRQPGPFRGRAAAAREEAGDVVDGPGIAARLPGCVTVTLVVTITGCGCALVLILVAVVPNIAALVVLVEASTTAAG